MVTHLVFWKLREEDPAEKQRLIAGIKERLEPLVGVVPGLLSAEVGANYNGGEYDVCLFSRLESREALESYATNPDHLKAAEYVRAAACARTAVDYESENILDPAIDPYVF